MTKKPFQGAGTALITPFSKEGSIDEPALRRVVEFQIRGGIDMIFPCGTTGEGATLEPEELELAIRIVIDQAKGRVAVIPGAGSNSTAKAVKGAELAKRLGASGVLSVGPYYNKPTQEGYYEHFKAVAQVGVPVVIYNIPSRTASNVEAGTLLRLAEVPNIVGVKESSGSLQQVMELIHHRPPDFRVLSGDDYLAISVVALGGDGVVSVASNEAPDLVRAMIDFALDGDLVRARELHYRLLPLMTVNFVETNPIPVKAALTMMGLIGEYYRLPLVAMTSANRQKLQTVLERLGLLQAVEVQR